MAPKKAVKAVSVMAKCVFCQNTRYIYAGEIPPGEVPFCSCGGPMVAVSASIPKKRRKA